MTYIGTPTSRIDGRAKVTGAAKYAAEYNTQDLAHAAVVTSSIAKGRIKRIDASEALRVAGVLAVLTRENRPRMAKSDEAYKDDVAPDGSPFRPLYDDRILFNNQPIALIAIYSLFNLPFAIWMLKGFLDEIPLELEDAALVDGASRWVAFWRVVLHWQLRA